MKEKKKPTSLKFIYYDLPPIFTYLKFKKKFFLIYYYFWQIAIGIKANKLNRKYKYDIMHHLTGNMSWMPAGLALAKGKLIWGPIGSLNLPKESYKYLNFSEILFEKVRSILKSILHNFDPLLRISFLKSVLILTHTPKYIPKYFLKKSRYFNQTYINDSKNMAIKKINFSRQKTLKIIYCGELKKWKGAEIGLESVLEFMKIYHNADFTIIGDGPCKNRIKKLREDSIYKERIKLEGRLSLDEVVKKLNNGDIFLYPSYRHGLSTIVLQAMLSGLPVICIEGDETSRCVKENNAGICVSLPESRKELISNISSAINLLANEEELRLKLAINSQTTALKRYNYEIAIQRIIKFYEKINDQK